MDREARALLVEASLLPVLVPAGFRVFGVSRTQAYLRRWAMSWRAERQRPSEPRRTILAARRAQRAVKRSLGIEGACLSRSLTLWTLLLRRGVETELRVGIRKTDGKVEGARVAGV